MAKTKTKSKQRTRPAKRAPRGPRAGGLDAAAADYARLLADPCNQRLVHPIYPGGDAGFLYRAESFGSFGAAPATRTSGVVHWTPGYVNASNTEILQFDADAPGTSSALNAYSGAPGKSFLATNARGVRCVAACMKILFNGTEAARAGRVHYGHTSAGMMDVSQSFSADGVAQALQHYSRTPTDIIELYWRPNVADTEFNDPSEVASAQLRDRKAALTFAWAGLPAGVGVTIHFTAIYEWTPAPALGIGHNAMGKAVSRNSLDDVLDYLKNMGFTFARSAGQVAGGALSAGFIGAMGAVYGSMPAVPRSRRMIAFGA